MATSNKTPPGPLAMAASALESELRRYEETSTQLESLPLNSEKTLQRARKVLEECAAHQEALAVLLPAFAQAMQAAQNRQEKCMTVTAEGTQRIKVRFNERVALLERVAALGHRAQEIHQPIAELSAALSEPTNAEEAENQNRNQPAVVLKSLEEVNARTEAVIEEAESVRKAATEAEWLDIARDAQTLKEQLQSARNKILVAQRNVASRAPS